MARDYERSTSETSLDRLPSQLRGAIAAHADARDLTLDPVAPAFLTRSRRLRRPGRLARMTGTADRDTEHLTALVLGGRDVVVATYGAARGTAVLSARLEDVDVGDLPLPVDDGVSITGFATSVEGHAARGAFFVGLGPPRGDAAREALRAAVRVAKRG
jgi:hypothetical protein